jgi:hypothetical protein
MMVMIDGTKSRTRNAMQENKRLNKTRQLLFPFLLGAARVLVFPIFVFVQFVEKRWVPVWTPFRVRMSFRPQIPFLSRK